MRRLSIVRAPGGKSRVIAIFDYWSQCALRQLHLTIIGKLDTWFKGTDMTMNQLAFFSRIPETKGLIYSFDLSSATDRFPVNYQKFCMGIIIGQEYTDRWASLMTKLPFLVSGNLFKKEDRGKYVYYGAGQPMGGYSSWAVFALCHHILVRSCGYMVYKTSSFSSYFILGDDLVIFDERVAKLYYRMVTLLGVKISIQKSIISPDSFEFAKRIVISGRDVSPLPWTQLLRVNNPLTVLATFLSDYIVRSVVHRSLSTTTIRKWISALPGKRIKSSYSVIAPILLQTVLIAKRLGTDIR